MISDLKPYSEYKYSGLPWLGLVPGHWKMRRTKVLLRERVEKGFPNEPLLAATQSKGVVRKEDYGTRTVTAQKDFHLLKLVEIGDFVISLRSFEGGVEVAHSRGIISPAYTVLEPRSKATSGFLRHFFKSPVFISSLTLFVTGIREGQNIDYERLSRAFLPLPPAEDQAAIVRFLDHATHRLDKAIQAKRKTIALLNEQKQAIIHRAVTCGLPAEASAQAGIAPDVPLKDSGIPWLGQIPAHWESLRCRYLFREVDSHSLFGEETHLSMSQKLGLVPSSLVERRTLISASYAGAKLCEVDDLVLNRLKAHLGVFARARESGVISPDYTVLRKIRPMAVEYFELVLRSPACRGELKIRAKGLVEGFWRLYTDDFYDIRLPVPPHEEQLRIVSGLQGATKEITTTIQRIEREIELLREYRTRLIADVVTGKLDVREAAERLPEMECAPADEPELVEMAESGEELAEEDA